MNEVLVFATILLFPLSMSISYSSAEPNGLTIDLIHRDSPLSPYHNSSMTQSNFLIIAAFRSISRVKRFYFTDPGQSNAEETTLITKGAAGSDYLMQIFIGTPPVEALAEVDTGSDLIWIQCLRKQCNPQTQQCNPQINPIFDPKNSTTFQEVPCYTDTCRLLDFPACGYDQCMYELDFRDKSVAYGRLANETVSFNNNGQLVTYPNTTLGCDDNTGTFLPTGNGIVGLGGGPLSLVTQLGDKVGPRKFSYCIPPYNTTGTTKLKLGVDTQRDRTGVVTSPLVSRSPSTFYYLSLEGVSINGMVVNPEQILGNIIIDSGTTLTFLKSDLYDQVEAAVVEAIGDQSFPERDPPNPFKLCYRDGSIKNFPNITFQFFAASNNELQLSQAGLFGSMRHMVCFLIIPTDGDSILGNLLQVSYNIEYDIDESRVSFAPADCTKE